MLLVPEKRDFIIIPFSFKIHSYSFCRNSYSLSTSKYFWKKHLIYFLSNSRKERENKIFLLLSLFTSSYSNMPNMSSLDTFIALTHFPCLFRRFKDNLRNGLWKIIFYFNYNKNCFKDVESSCMLSLLHSKQLNVITINRMISISEITVRD